MWIKQEIKTKIRNLKKITIRVLYIKPLAYGQSHSKSS